MIYFTLVFSLAGTQSHWVMLSKGRIAMTPDQLTGAARNLAHGLGIPVYIRMAGSTSRGRASRSYRQVVPAQR